MIGYEIKLINDTKEEIIYSSLENKNLISAKLQENINKISSFVFSIPVTHSLYDDIKKLQSEIVVREIYSDVEMFRGRVVEEDIDFYNTKEITCESVLSYLNDTKKAPYIHTGSIRNFLALLLDEHNKKVSDRQKIYLGTVTVVDNNDYIRRESENYEYTLKIIQDKIVSKYGGVLLLRRANGKNYLDYLKDYDISNQKISFGENLVDLNKFSDIETLRTVVVPLGARDQESGKRLDITSVNSGKNYLVNNELLSVYGYIEETVEFDDVTVANNLKQKGQEYLDSCSSSNLTMELNAVDLKLLGVDVRRISTGMNVKVTSKPHNLDEIFLCVSKTTNLLDASADKITLGNEFKTFTDTNNKDKQEVIDKIESGDKLLSEEIQQARDDFKEDIENASGLFTTTVKESDGSTKIYYHDKKNLNDSMIIMTFNTAGFAISSNGGETWYGMNINGDFIANILNAEGVNANWIRTGTMSADRIRSGVLESTNKKLNFDLNTATLNVYDNNNKLNMKLHQTGQSFYDAGRLLGTIGKNEWKNRPDVHGLIFQLNYNGGDYMTWARQEQSGGDYITYLTYHNGKIDRNGLHLGKPLYSDSQYIFLDNGATTSTVSYPDGGGIRTSNRLSLTKKGSSSDPTQIAIGGGNIDVYNNIDMHNWSLLNNSDIRLKTNIQESDDVLQKINALPVYSYDWVGRNKHIDVGLVADYVEQILPNVVSKNDDGVKCLDYIALIPYLIKSIQELSEKVGEYKPSQKFAALFTYDEYEEKEKIEFFNKLKEKENLIPEAGSQITIKGASE